MRAVFKADGDRTCQTDSIDTRRRYQPYIFLDAHKRCNVKWKTIGNNCVDACTALAGKPIGSFPLKMHRQLLLLLLMGRTRASCGRLQHGSIRVLGQGAHLGLLSASLLSFSSERSRNSSIPLHAHLWHKLTKGFKPLGGLTEPCTHAAGSRLPPTSNWKPSHINDPARVCLSLWRGNSKYNKRER